MDDLRQGSVWVVPQELHQPILQNAVLLSRAIGNRAARDFLDFIQSSKASAIIESFGYTTVEK